ncbi:MAG TPA: hydroxymethylglutaryl-CoA lyase, partial [Candidatus Limnocylindria bacterium]|nr:hydroxymethylglutaryl-CoA lyase [Candidatus Limnocylindria bacterium]
MMDGVDVRIYEVGPRDGLQAEATVVPTQAKLRFIELLADAGLREIEATSFVSPTAIPQLADADDLLRALPRRPGIRYPVLVPNERGMTRALAAGADAICLFTAATDAYAEHNIGMSVARSLEVFAPMARSAREHGIWLRGYVSTAFGCPYSGEVDERAVIDVSRRLLELGVEELSISDTVGAATPTDV